MSCFTNEDFACSFFCVFLTWKRFTTKSNLWRPPFGMHEQCGNHAGQYPRWKENLNKQCGGKTTKSRSLYMFLFIYTANYSSSTSNSSDRALLSTPGSAIPLVPFIAWPMNHLNILGLPFRIVSACRQHKKQCQHIRKLLLAPFPTISFTLSGCFAINSWHSARRVSKSPMRAHPFFSTISCGILDEFSWIIALSTFLPIGPTEKKRVRC